MAVKGSAQVFAIYRGSALPTKYQQTSVGQLAVSAELFIKICLSGLSGLSDLLFHGTVQ
jgi:hypothetical protein